jgi:hypothetical protein
MFQPPRTLPPRSLLISCNNAFMLRLRLLSLTNIPTYPAPLSPLRRPLPPSDGHGGGNAQRTRHIFNKAFLEAMWEHFSRETCHVRSTGAALSTRARNLRTQSALRIEAELGAARQSYDVCRQRAAGTLGNVRLRGSRTRENVSACRTAKPLAPLPYPILAMRWPSHARPADWFWCQRTSDD